jgi:hypothetical protein
MLKCFFEKQETPGRNLFEHLAIWQAGEEYREHYARYPVIYLTFKNIKSSTWKDCHTDLRQLIQKLYWDYYPLLEEKSLNPMEKKQLSLIMENDPAGEYKNALVLLSRCLHKVNKSKVIILIDEYDIPIQQGYSGGFYKKSVEFTKAFLSGGLKDNPHIPNVLLDNSPLKWAEIFSNNRPFCKLFRSSTA